MSNCNLTNKRLTLKNSVAYIDDSLLPEMVFLIPKKIANKRFMNGLNEEFITISVYMDRAPENDPLLLLDLEPGTYLNLQRKYSNNNKTPNPKQRKIDTVVDNAGNNNNDSVGSKYGYGGSLYITKLYCQVDTVEILKGGRHAEISIKLVF